MNVNRKAAVDAMKVLVELIIFVIVFFVFFKIGAEIWQIYVSKPKTVTENSLTLLEKHIKYFDGTSDPFPLQVASIHIIRGYDSSSGREECKASCIAIVKEGDTIYRTIELESFQTYKENGVNMQKKIRLEDGFEVKSNEGVSNYVLTESTNCPDYDEESEICISISEG
jgi:hypothetical protein